MIIEFEIVKKIPRAAKGAPGLILRSFVMNPGAAAEALLFGESYDKVRSLAAPLPVRCRAAGRALSLTEISEKALGQQTPASSEAAAETPAAAPAADIGSRPLVTLLSKLPFESEEVSMAFEFLALPDKPFAALSAGLLGDSFNIKARACIPGLCESEKYFDELSALLDRCGMGVIKPSSEELSEGCVQPKE